MSAVLSVRDLGKRYGATVGVEGVSFEVGRGEIVGLLGPNGAGKTTIISTILGVLEPSAGTIVAGRAPSWSALAGAAALAALYVVGASVVFARVHRHAVRTGLIARYSAESVT